MSDQIKYNFDNGANYTGVNAEILAGFGQLSLIDKIAQTFIEDFLNDAGFTYDNTAISCALAS